MDLGSDCFSKLNLIQYIAKTELLSYCLVSLQFIFWAGVYITAHGKLSGIPINNLVVYIKVMFFIKPAALEC